MVPTPTPLSYPPAPEASFLKTLLEEMTGCQVLTHFLEDNSKPGDGYMSVIYSVTADLLVTPKNGEPRKEVQHFLFKCFPRHPARQSLLRKTNFFHNELSFYRVWVKALCDFQIETVGLSEDAVITPPFPPFVGGKSIDFLLEGEKQAKTCNFQPFDNFIVMTDLKKSEGFQMVNKTSGLDWDHLALAFTELAKMHALSWAYKKKLEWNLARKHPFLKPRFDEEDKELWINIMRGNAEIAIKAMDGVLGEGNPLSKSTNEFKKKVPQFLEYSLEQDEETERRAWELHRSPPQKMVEESRNERPWRVQIHGDAWSNNMLFKYDDVSGKPTRVVLFDFQLTREGCPTVDLAVLLYTSTTAQFRKEQLDGLLQLYCDKFVGFCEHLRVDPLPGFQLDSLKRRLHRNKPSGYMIAIVGFPNIFMDKTNGQEADMDQAGGDADLEKILTEALSKGALESALYKERIIDVTQELHDEGVI